MTLDEQEKILVRDLSRNPVFGGLMEKLKEHAHVPTYKPRSEKDQVNDWVYHSGYARGIEYVVNLLGYSDERRN